MSTEAKWAEWYATRDKYSDRQDWYDARPEPIKRSMAEMVKWMARPEAMSSFSNDPIGEIDRAPMPGAAAIQAEGPTYRCTCTPA